MLYNVTVDVERKPKFRAKYWSERHQEKHLLCQEVTAFFLNYDLRPMPVFPWGDFVYR
jgi:hypothetical protein